MDVYGKSSDFQSNLSAERNLIYWTDLAKTGHYVYGHQKLW